MGKEKLRLPMQRQSMHVVANLEMRNIACFKNRQRVLVGSEALDSKVFSIIGQLVSRHVTIPKEVRNRLLANVPNLYSLSEVQYQRLSFLQRINRDRVLLTKKQLDSVYERSIERLLWFDTNIATDDSAASFIYRLPPLTSNKTPGDPKHFQETFIPDQERERAMSAPVLPRPEPCRHDNKPLFNIPKQTGPYVWDSMSGRFRSQAVFIRSGTLGNEER